jgi:hypothetical protein
MMIYREREFAGPSSIFWKQCQALLCCISLMAVCAGCPARGSQLEQAAQSSPPAEQGSPARRIWTAEELERMELTPEVQPEAGDFAPLHLACSAGPAAARTAPHPDLPRMPWSGPEADPARSGQTTFCHDQDVSFQRYAFDPGDPEQFSELKPIGHPRKGYVTYKWTLKQDFTWREPGKNVPATLIFVQYIPNGEPSCTPEDYKVLALQDFALDSTKPIELAGTIDLPARFEQPEAELQYGIDASSLLKLFTDASPLFDASPSGHYSQDSDRGLKRKEFRRVGPNTYEFYFEAVNLMMNDGAGEVFQVGLYDKDGWMVGVYRGLIKAWGTAGPVPERRLMHATGEPAYMRVYYPGQTAG